jgi:SAM-dependent methyltransferase
MSENVFDEYANAYDAWFEQNLGVLGSEVAMLARALGAPGRTLSVGCGSGLFEMLLARDHGIAITEGIEPAEAMAAIARKRGMTVRIGTAEEADFGEGYDTVLFNGTPSYIADLGHAVGRVRDALVPGGRIVMADVPKESAYALLYNLGVQLGDWDHPLVKDVRPAVPYPLELAGGANWRTTAEKLAVLQGAGFRVVDSWQTLCRHPVFTNDGVEEPLPGYDRGGYVALVAVK